MFNRCSRGNEAPFSFMKTPPGRRVRARGLQDCSEKLSSGRPGALTGQVFKQALTPSRHVFNSLNPFNILTLSHSYAFTLLLLAATLASAAPATLAETQNNTVALEALSRLQGIDLNTNPNLKAVVLKLLDQTRGTAQFVQITKQFHFKDQDAGLLDVAIANPASDFGVEAIRVILANHDTGLLKRALEGTNVFAATRTAEALGNAAEKQTVSLLLPLVSDDQRDIGLRKQAVRALAQTSEGAAQLLQLAKDNQLPDSLKFIASTELSSVRWPALKAEAARVLPLPSAQNSLPLPPLRELLKMKGDAANGEKVFFRQAPGCSSCHQVKGKGAQIGPDLSEIGTKLGKDALIESILDPNAGISVGYETYSLELKSGDEAYGLLASESSDEVAIKDLKGIVTRYKKSEIASRRQLKTSIMPSGLQQGMTAQEFADLLEFVSSLKK